MINKAKLSAPWFLSIVVWMVLSGCSKQSEPQIANVKSLPDSIHKTVRSIMSERAAELGLKQGYDARKQRFTSIVSLKQSQGDSVPATAEAIIFFLKDVGTFINVTETISNSDTTEFKVDEKNFFGMDSFLSIMRYKRKVMSTEYGVEKIIENLDTEILVEVADEKAAYSLKIWTISPAAAALIVKRFEAARGKILAEDSFTVENGPRAGLMDKAWLITIPIEKPPQ
jgi:hypothetical protein